jgi:hypothetical protein
MPPKKGAKGKKKLPRESEEEAVTAVDVQYNPDIIPGLLSELKDSVDSKCLLIKKDIDFMATSIRQALQLELIKLPKQVKEMTLSRFKLEFGDNLEAVTRGAMEGKKMLKDEKMEAPMTASKASRSQSKVFQTPVSGKNFVMETPRSSRKLRSAKEGEVILSANGSPLGEFSTVVKAPKQGGSSIIPATPGVFVPLATGEVLNLDEITELSEDVKEEALNKMQEMMNNMQSMMEKFRAKK